jgi:NAD(P)-dependent dehydrogenase (short-subunit alcohol dehydrogenase family)
MSKNAIVIGASSGIGFALTQALLERSFAVGACSRHLEPLQILQEKFSRERCLVQRMDVTELEEASRTLQALIGQLSDVQLIILNAGVGHLNPDLDWKLDQEVIRTNVLGFTALACVATKYFEQRGEGRLVGISSISALRGNRHATSYAASKAYIILYSGPAKRKAQGCFRRSAKCVGKGFADRQCFCNSPSLDIYFNSLRPLQGIRTHIIFKRTSEKETSLGVENSEVQVSPGG